MDPAGERLCLPIRLQTQAEEDNTDSRESSLKRMRTMEYPIAGRTAVCPCCDTLPARGSSVVFPAYDGLELNEDCRNFGRQELREMMDVSSHFENRDKQSE
jgi:hypothetical protein